MECGGEPGKFDVLANLHFRKQCWRNLGHVYQSRQHLHSQTTGPPFSELQVRTLEATIESIELSIVHFESMCLATNSKVVLR